MKREKIMERDIFTYEEKQRISQKSDEKCCHCGRKVYFDGYGATIDHYIPLYKGGTNRDINLVMLCEECNKKKDTKIIPPRDYLCHLKEEYLHQLEGYFDSYIKSFEYLSRRRILSCDEYLIQIIPYIKGARPETNYPTKKYLLKRMCEKDIEKVSNFYKEYLIRNNFFDGDDAVSKNIEFWNKFGCIMYLENSDGIKNMYALTIRELSPYSRYKSIPKILQMTTFSKYRNMATAALTDAIRGEIAHILANEQGLDNVLTVCSIPKKDPLSYKVITFMGKYHSVEDIPGFLSSYTIHNYGKEKNIEKTKEFFDIFDEVEKDAIAWLSENEQVSWMMNLLKDNYSTAEEARYKATMSLTSEGY